QHGLQYAFGPQSYARLAAAFSDPTSATASQVAPYAEYYFEYDSSQRVTLETAQGLGCSSCSNGLGTYEYSYSLPSGNSNDYNHWQYKTIETCRMAMRTSSTATTPAR